MNTVTNGRGMKSSHSGQQRGSERKRAKLTARKKELQIEAAELGISVEDLKARRRQEAQAILEKAAQAAKRSRQQAPSQSRSFGYFF